MSKKLFEQQREWENSEKEAINNAAVQHLKEDDNSVPDFLQFVPNKANIKAAGEQLLHLIESGAESALKVATVKRFFSDLFEQINDPLREKVLDEMRGSKEVSAEGARFEQVELGTRYDYAGCGDSYYNDLCEKKTLREALLKTLKMPIEIVNPDTGELMLVNPPVKRSTSGYKITFSK